MNTMILVLLLWSLPIFLMIHILLQMKPPKTLLLRPPPGPPGLPFIGNLHQISTADNLHIYLHKLSKKYGPIMRVKLGSKPVIIVSSAKLAKQVLKTHDSSFCSRPKLLGQQKLSYNFLDIALSPYNDYWRDVRKITSLHLFSLKKSQSFRPIREDEISRTVTKIAAAMSASLSSDSPAVNLSEIIMALTTTLICRTAFGTRYEEQGSERQRFDRLLNEAQAALAAFYVSDYFPLFGWVDKLSGQMNRLNTTFEKLDLFYQELIDDHLDRPKMRKEEDGEDHGDILDVLIRLKEQKSFSNDFTWDHIKALLMNIFIAGTDTSAASVIWAMHALIKAPAFMKRVQTEVRDFVGGKGKVDEDDVQKLPYLRAVIYEAFRLYPSVPLLVPRETTEKCILEGYEIQPETMVYVNASSVGRDPEYWGNNADEFLPDRFLNINGAINIDIKGQDFGVLPFGSGRRICPGIFIGIANVELILANLLYCFDWELPHAVKEQDIDDDASPGITMHKKNPLLLVPKKYRTNI